MDKEICRGGGYHLENGLLGKTKDRASKGADKSSAIHILEVLRSPISGDKIF
jgi:hypothetical protein